MFRRVIWEAPEEYVADLAGNNVVPFLVGRKPIGTCDDVLLLPSLVVKRNLTGRQRLYNNLDVDFRATGDTYMKIWKGEFHKLLHEIENDFPRGWHPKSVWTFIERVHNDICLAVIG